VVGWACPGSAAPSAATSAVPAASAANPHPTARLRRLRIGGLPSRLVAQDRPRPQDRIGGAALRTAQLQTAYPAVGSTRPGQELRGPGRVVGRERRLGGTLVEVILVARRVVDVVEDLLEVEPGVFVGVAQRDRDGGQPVRQEEGPQAR